jgi:hypothetical protein
MTQRIALLGVITLAMLAACSKQAPPQPPAETNAVPPPVAAPAPVDEPIPVERAQKATGLLTLIDTRPECETFRTQLEDAGKVLTDKPMQSDIDKMNQVFADAHAAGCTRKP